MPNGKKGPPMRAIPIPPGGRIPTTINPKDLEPFECSVCGSTTFARACSIGRISALQSPTGQEAIGDFDTGYLCGGCGGHNTHVPSKEVEEEKKQVKSALAFGAEGSGSQREKPTDQPTDDGKPEE